jgi:uncharacterized membrane protein
MAKHKYTPEEIEKWWKTHNSFIYFNRDDSNYIVPKPDGYGRTTNWAHPLSWVFAAIIVALFIYALFFRQTTV